jgi:lysophospholipase L1-like esterase
VRIYFALLCIVLAAATVLAQDQNSGKEYPNPARFEEAIREFEMADEEEMPPKKAIVCIGSSSMRGWHEGIYDDLAPLTIIPRGFGGSNMNDALYYADRIVLPYKPRAVVLYEGDNDIAQGIAPDKILQTFRAFVEKIHAEYPEARIYFLSIKPSMSRWHMWSRMQEANALIAEECEGDKRLVYVDVAAGMLDDEDKPRADIFKEDKLHMNRNGYEIWRDILRPVIIRAEWPHE